MWPGGCAYCCGMASVMVLVCCVISAVGYVDCWLLSSGRVVISCAGLWWSAVITLCLASVVGHPVGVCCFITSEGLLLPLSPRGRAAGRLVGVCGSSSSAGLF